MDTTTQDPSAHIAKSNVISLTRHATKNVLNLSDLRPDHRYPALKQLEAYWHAKRGDQLVPSRKDINPRGIEDTLEYAFISEEIAPGMARFRIAGMHMTDLMGFDVRGMPMSSFFKANARAVFKETLQAVFEGPQIVTLDVTSRGKYGAPTLDGRLMMLPLSGDDGTVTRMLGALVTLGPIGRSPRTFEITQVKRTVLKATDVAVRSKPAPTTRVQTQPQPQQIDQQTPRKSTKPNLRLLSFDS